MKKPANKLTLPRKNMAIQVGIVDDDERVRTSLAQAVDRFPGCTCTGQYSSGEEAVGHFQKQSPPKVVLMDINMPGMGGIECARQIKDAHPDTEIIMLTAYQDTEMVFKSLAAGASGYLLKRADREELVSAIHQVINGGSPMTSHIARKVVQAFRVPTTNESDKQKLSPRELEVLELLSKGYLYKEISESLGLSYETVHNYIRRIYEKLRVRSRSQAVAKYFEGKSPAGTVGIR